MYMSKTGTVTSVTWKKETRVEGATFTFPFFVFFSLRNSPSPLLVFSFRRDRRKNEFSVLSSAFIKSRVKVRCNLRKPLKIRTLFFLVFFSYLARLYSDEKTIQASPEQFTGLGKYIVRTYNGWIFKKVI